MFFNNPVVSKAYLGILNFCKYHINDAELKFRIKQLAQNDLRCVDRHGNTLFLATINLNEHYSGQRCSYVMQLLAEHAKQLDQTMDLVLFLLSAGNLNYTKPMQKILDMGCMHTIPNQNPHQTDHVGVAFFNILLQITPSYEHQMHSFKITNTMLQHAFLCKFGRIRQHFLGFCHYSIHNQLLPLIELQKFYLQPDSSGFRLFDTLILRLPNEGLVAFYQELRLLSLYNWITQEQHESILASHTMHRSGYSPLHEILSTHCVEKIIDYFNELTCILRPETLNAALKKENKHGFSAMQQGVNNGLEVASPDVSRLFLNLLDPTLGVFTLDECLTIVNGHSSKRLRCIHTKVNSKSIQLAINDKRNDLFTLKEQRNQTINNFSYASASPTLTYFNSNASNCDYASAKSTFEYLGL